MGCYTQYLRQLHGVGVGRQRMLVTQARHLPKKSAQLNINPVFPGSILINLGTFVAPATMLGEPSEFGEGIDTQTRFFWYNVRWTSGAQRKQTEDPCFMRDFIGIR